MSFAHLFEPGYIGNCRVKNRIIMAPIGNINMSDPIGRPLAKMIDYFVERARGGTGLLITGLVPVSFGIDPTISEENDTSYFPRIDGSSRTRLAGWRDLIAGVHAYDARLFLQLTAGLGRVGSPESMLKGKILKSASLNRNFYVPQLPHFPFSDRAIKKMVKSFGQSAINARVSGADGIQLHGHEGYLMDQLTSQPWNRRKMGRYRNRYQFALDIVEEIQRACGEDFPIIYRIDLTQGLQECYGEKIFKQRFRGMERSIQEGLEFCRELASAGVAAFDVDKGCYDNWFYPHPPAYFDDIPYVEEIAGKLKSYFDQHQVKAQVIAVGKLGRPERAEEVLEQGWADFVMLGRPLLADPYWPQKVREGRIREIIHCIGDQEGCIQSFILGGHPCCAVNAYTGFEDTKKLIPASRIKKVAVVGAGPAGCEAARTALARGHQVTLFEKQAQIGGQLIIGASMKIKHDLATYLSNLQYQMLQLVDQGLDLRLGQEATLADLKEKYEVIICGTGLHAGMPVIEGMEAMPNAEVRQFLLAGMQLTPDVKRVTIVGGGLTGCELAYTLASERNVKVTLVERQDNLMSGVVQANRAMLLWMLMGKGSPGKIPPLITPVSVYISSEIIRIDSGKVMIKANRKRKDPYTPWHTLIPDNIHNPFDKKLKQADVEIISLETDYLIFATGGQSNYDLYYELLETNAAPEIYCVGDAQHPARVWEAVTSANEVARFI